MTDNKILAEKLLPWIDKTISYYEDKYPARKNTGPVTRYAPSPTWYMHIGWIFTSLIDDRFAHQSWWVFFLRLEDTDKKRELVWWVQNIVQAFQKFGIEYDEWVLDDEYNEKWDYGPYTQSFRKEIYQTFAKDLIEKWLAYPCFMTSQELEEIRSSQQASKIVPGIYWNFSRWRNASFEEIQQQLDQNKEFVIRLKSPCNPWDRIVVKDELRGETEMNANFIDIVILKSDGMPTYHFAHLVDDYLMRTTHVIRADERFPSLPLHYQLFDLCWLPKPKYIHIAPLVKLDGNSKRKLSKRSDPEANVEYYFENGYHATPIIEYLFTIIDSGYEDWKKANPWKWYKDYNLNIMNLWTSGALLDMAKLDSVSNEFLSELSTQELYNIWIKWAEKFDQKLFELMNKYPEYTVSALNIERHIEKDPKRFTRLTDLRKQLELFFDETYSELLNNKPAFPENITQEIFDKIVKFYSENYDENMDMMSWFEQMKSFASQNGFALNNQEFKTWNYIWKVGDVAMVLRIALCASKTTPDLHQTMKVLWKQRVINRLQSFKI